MDQRADRREFPLRVLLATVCALLIVLAGATAARAQDDALGIVPGETTRGTVASLGGDLWTTYACEGDVIALAAQSDDFTPWLEVYGPGSDEPIAEVEGSEGAASLDDLEIAESGVYTVAVTGERRADGGDYEISLALAGASDDDIPDLWLPFARWMTGTVRSRYGEEWQIHACEGDTLRIEARSDAYSPYIELTAVGDDEVLAAGEGEDGAATIDGFEVPQTGDYRVAVAGDEHTDRGDYMLWLQTDAMQPAEPGAYPAVNPAKPTPTRSSSLRPSPTRTPAAVARPSEPTCDVQIPGLNLRAGPGTTFPVIGSLANGTRLRALGRNEAATWVEVEVPGSAQSGWVSAGPQYVSCSTSVSSVPLAALIPVAPTNTPTPRSVPTSTPTFTPTPTPQQAQPPAPPPPPAQVIVPAPGSGDDNIGTVGMDVRMGRQEDGNAVFRERFTLRLEPNPSAEVRRVEFTMAGDDGEVVYTTEESYPFCMFGDSGGQCTGFELRGGAQWPDELLGSSEAKNGLFTVRISASDGSQEIGNWTVPVCIDSDNLPNADFDCGNGDDNGGQSSSEPLTVYLEEAAPGGAQSANGQVTVRVCALDPGRGQNCGDGIDDVHMELFDPNGTRVHDRSEGTYGFCLYGGGEPDCTAYDYAGNGYTWDSGDSVVTGTYVLRATVRADDGRTEVSEFTFDVN